MRPSKLANVIFFMHFRYTLLHFWYKRNVCQFLVEFKLKTCKRPPGKMLANVPPKNLGGWPDDDDGKMSKNNFKPCHHIEFNTLNPNPILKITISFTKTPPKSKYFLFFNLFWKFPKTQFFIRYYVYVP